MIGVFDSGVGGLSVLREIRKLLPNIDAVYFGDTANVPYGGKSPEEIQRLVLKAGANLMVFHPDAIVVACNTASAFALPYLQARLKAPILGVIEPGAKKAAATTRNHKVGIIATSSTIKSGKYTQKLKKANGRIQTFGQACPLFVPLVEEGWFDHSVTYQVALELMDIGASALLIGIGPGSACTTRGVLGLGVPQVTAISDSMAAREFYFKKKGKYIPIIADGGMSTGGDVCKAFACGADAVMIGSAFARAKEAPGRGFHWGMATPHANLPRGTRIKVSTTGTLDEILFGPAKLDDGTQNLVGALRTCMGNVGAQDIRELQMTEIIIAPAIRTEGKLFQSAQKVGMMK